MLIEIQPLVDIAALALQSVFVSNEPNGINLIIISSPETAKTSTLFQFANLNFVAYYDEITQKKILDEFLPQVKLGQKKVMLIPDFINCIDKQKATREQFLSVIKSGIDDTGIMKIETYHKHFDLREIALQKEIAGVKFTITTAITGTSFKLIKRKLVETGLLSRFIPFTYNYPLNKVTKIFNMLETEKSENNVNIPKIKQRETEITADPEHIRKFEIFATKLGEQYGGFGIRALIMFRRMLKASALLHNRKHTTEKDVEYVMNLTKWINFDFNPL